MRKILAYYEVVFFGLLALAFLIFPETHSLLSISTGLVSLFFCLLFLVKYRGSTSPANFLLLQKTKSINFDLAFIAIFLIWFISFLNKSEFILAGIFFILFLYKSLLVKEKIVEYRKMKEISKEML